MEFISNRLTVLSTFIEERRKFGMVMDVPDRVNEAIFILDGVGGFQFAPLVVRKTLRELGSPIQPIMYRWQYGIVGEILTDLVWLRRNRLKGIQLARSILALRRRNPNARIHILAYSGGAGIAVFACEALKGRPIIETLVLACPAISPGYNLAPGLRSVRRAYALTSRRDVVLLGIGTRLLGTTDRVYSASAGMRRFRLPQELEGDDRTVYERMREICWTPELRIYSHTGGHTGWVMPDLLREHLIPILEGRPRLPTHAVRP